MIVRRPSIDPVHPGEILRKEVLPALAMSGTELAVALGISRRAFRDVLDEKRPLAAGMAVRIGKSCGNGSRFRARLQLACDLSRAERAVDVSRIPTLAARSG